MHTVEVNGIQKHVPANFMDVGDIAVVIESGAQSFNELLGHTVVMTYSGLVSLTNPHNTWSEVSSTWPNFKVRVLPAGTKVTITVGE